MFTTDEGPPPAPMNLTAVALALEAVQVCWQALEDPDGPRVSYKVVHRVQTPLEKIQQHEDRTR